METDYTNITTDVWRVSVWTTACELCYYIGQNWIKSCLSNRKQRVSVNGALSDITGVTSGVPQGSVLGPVLFLLYINDIDGNITFSIRLFADDSIIYRKISSKTDHEILKIDLNQLKTWSDKWQMEFNVSKCVHLPITNKIKPQPT